MAYECIGGISKIDGNQPHVSIDVDNPKSQHISRWHPVAPGEVRCGAHPSWALSRLLNDEVDGLVRNGVKKMENGRGGTTGFKRFPGSNACVPALATKAGVHAAHQHLQFIRMDFDHLPDLFCSCFPG